MVYEYKQVKIKKVTVNSVMRRKAFVKGFMDKKNNKPWDDSIVDVHEQWNYERGRLLACIYDGAIKIGKKVHPEARLAYAVGRVRNEII